MSSTTNVQNLLVNVFRPTTVYDTTGGTFQVKLDMSNINAVYANDFYAPRADIGDSNNNLFVGFNAGDVTGTAGCSNNTALGVYAGFGMSNSTNCTFVGYTAGQASSNSDNTIAVGANAKGTGDWNIYIGNNTGGAGSSNLFLGHNLSATALVSNTMYIGQGTPLITGKFAAAAPYTQRVGILDSNPVYPISLGNYTYVLNGLGINCDPAQHSLNVNGDCRMEDGYGLLQFDQNQTSSNSIFSVESYTPGKILEATLGSVTNDASVNVFGQVGTTKGFYSKQGTASLVNGATATIDTVAQKGLVMVSVLCPAAAAPYFWGNWLYTGAVLTTVTSNNSQITVTASAGSNLILSNTSAGTQTFHYNITYFPVP